MKRALASAVIILLAFVASPAGAQTDGTGWSPGNAWVAESAGKIVLTFTKTSPGRIVYWTVDGNCSNFMPQVNDPTEPECSSRAHAPEDYGAVRGEMLFTRAGTRTVTVTIVDDDLDEDQESFWVMASEGDDVAGQTPMYAALIYIYDYNAVAESEDPAATATTTTTTPAGRRPSSSAAIPAPIPSLPPAGGPGAGGSARPPTEVASRPSNEGGPANEELRPGAGFELTGDAVRTAAPQPRGGAGGSAPWLALALGGGVLAAGGMWVWVRRRRHWSPTRP